MVTIKEKLSIEIESTPEAILEKVLDYLQYLKAKVTQPPTHLIKVSQTEEEPILRGAKAKDLLKFAGTWQGEDFEECLQLVYDTRSQTKF